MFNASLCCSGDYEIKDSVGNKVTINYRADRKNNISTTAPTTVATAAVDPSTTTVSTTSAVDPSTTTVSTTTAADPSTTTVSTTTVAVAASSTTTDTSAVTSNPVASAAAPVVPRLLVAMTVPAVTDPGFPAAMQALIYNYLKIESDSYYYEIYPSNNGFMSNVDVPYIVDANLTNTKSNRTNAINKIITSLETTSTGPTDLTTLKAQAILQYKSQLVIYLNAAINNLILSINQAMLCQSSVSQCVSYLNSQSNKAAYVSTFGAISTMLQDIYTQAGYGFVLANKSYFANILKYMNSNIYLQYVVTSATSFSTSFINEGKTTPAVITANASTGSTSSDGNSALLALVYSPDNQNGLIIELQTLLNNFLSNQDFPLGDILTNLNGMASIITTGIIQGFFNASTGSGNVPLINRALGAYTTYVNNGTLYSTITKTNASFVSCCQYILTELCGTLFNFNAASNTSSGTAFIFLPGGSDTWSTLRTSLITTIPTVQNAVKSLQSLLATAAAPSCQYVTQYVTICTNLSTFLSGLLTLCNSYTPQTTITTNIYDKYHANYLQNQNLSALCNSLVTVQSEVSKFTYAA